MKKYRKKGNSCRSPLFLVKEGMNTPSYTCHRKFLADYMESNSLSMRDFVAKVEKVTSVSALSHFFKKDRSGKYIGSYSFRLDTWLEILGHLKLTKEEFDHLLLLKIKSDIEYKFHPKSGPVLSVKRILQRKNEAKPKINSIDKELTKKALCMGRIYDCLPLSLQKEMVHEAERLTEYFIAGQKRSSRITGVKNYLSDLLG